MRMVRTVWCTHTVWPYTYGHTVWVYSVGLSYCLDFYKTKATVSNQNNFILKYFKSETKTMSLKYMYFTKYTSSLISSRTCKFIVQCMKISIFFKTWKNIDLTNTKQNNLTSQKVILTISICAHLLFAPFASVCSMIWKCVNKTARPYTVYIHMVRTVRVWSEMLIWSRTFFYEILMKHFST